MHVFRVHQIQGSVNLWEESMQREAHFAHEPCPQTREPPNSLPIPRPRLTVLGVPVEQLFGFRLDLLPWCWSLQLSCKQGPLPGHAERKRAEHGPVTPLLNREIGNTSATQTMNPQHPLDQSLCRVPFLWAPRTARSQEPLTTQHLAHLPSPSLPMATRRAPLAKRPCDSVGIQSGCPNPPTSQSSPPLSRRRPAMAPSLRLPMAGVTLLPRALRFEEASMMWVRLPFTPLEAPPHKKKQGGINSK